MEKLNVLNAENSRERENNLSLKRKITRYSSLKNIIEEINQNLTVESVADHLGLIAFSLTSNNKGTCILYLVDNQTQKLMLFKTKKEDKNLVIKEKEGDIFDFWVLRHGTPLLIEDTRQDFRFDLEKLKAQEVNRAIASLISAPFVTDHNFLGILRLDNSQAHFYSQDDLRFLATLSDLGAVALENSQLYQRTQDLAIRDSLTSLFTKGYFLERLKEECKRSLRHNKEFSLLMLDIDYFKNYNDKFGHTAGDTVLKILSQNITELLKDLSPVISRFGGEEFCIILPNIEKKKAFSIAQKLRERIGKEKIILRRLETNVTVSIGVVTFPVDTADEIELLQKADRLMYQAKEKGRNRACCI